MKSKFLRWQCLIRQYAVRQSEGRPCDGIRPTVQLDNEKHWIGPITVLISKRDGSDITAQFRFIAKKNQDPKERMDAALKHLAEAHYQRPGEFNDELTALFAHNSQQLKAYLSANVVTLKFYQSGHEYIVPCTCQLLKEEDPKFQFTYWHNFMFNPTLPGSVSIAEFTPDWDKVSYRNVRTNEAIVSTHS